MNIVGNPISNGVISRSELTFIDQFVLDEARYCLPYLDHCYASNLPNAIEMEHNALLFSRQQSANYIFSDDMAVAAAFVDVEQDEFEKNKRNRSNFNQWNHSDGHKQDRYDDRTKDSVAGNMLETFSELLLREKNRVDKENFKHKKSLTSPIFNDASKRKSNFNSNNDVEVETKRNKTVSHFDNLPIRSNFHEERPIRKKKTSQIKDEYEGSVTRCVCGMSHDDGFMISCDKCGVWQHVACMALDKDKIPDSFLCELCSPRYVDKRRAIRIQTRKREELENPTICTEKPDISRMFGVKSSSSKKIAKAHKRSISFSDDDDDEFLNYDDEDNDFIYYGKSKQSTPSSASRSKKPVSNRKNGKLKVNFFPTRVTSSGFKRSNPISNLKKINKTTIASRLMSKSTAMVGSKLNKTESDSSKQNLTFKQMQRRMRVKVADVAPDTKGVIIQEAVRSPDLPIAEFIGRFYIKSDFEKSSNYDSSYRHVICSTNEDGIEICVDGRMSDSAIKHIRRSCISNCKIVTVKDDTGRDRIFICSSTQIPEGKEITVPFYFDYQKCNEEIFCPCKRASCVIGRYFRSRNTSRPIRMGSNEKSQEGILSLISDARLRPDRKKKKVPTATLR